MTQIPPVQSAQPAATAAAPAKPSTGTATAALILGIIGLIPLLGVVPALVAVILAILALAKGTAAKGRAVGGIVTGALGLTLGTVAGLVAILIPALGRTRELAQRAQCRNNLHQIGAVVMIYVNERDGRTPNDLASVQEYVPGSSILRCPAAKAGRSVDYFYHSPGRIVAVSRPAARMIACDFRGNHRGGRCVLYADGHVVWCEEADFRAELADEENAAFAAALKAADGPGTPPTAQRRPR